MIQAKQELLAALGAAVERLAPGQPYAPAFETPRQASHGDLAVTAAMQLARALRRNPRELAAALVEALRAQPAVQRWVEAVEIAGPGFVNLRLAAAARQSVVAEVLAAGERFGRRPAHGRRLMVEFVSANPTGPLHVGHGRQAALGDDSWPEDAYNGDYVAEIAAAYLARQTVHADDREFTAPGDPQDLDAIRQFAVAYLRHEQDLDLRAFGVAFDRRSEERRVGKECRSR